MFNVRKDIKNDKIKNKPNIVAPIINTVISGLAIIGVIVLKCLSSDFSWPLFICFLVVLLLFPVASWYNSYFAKKQKTKMLGSFEKETELIVEFMQHRKHFKAFEENDKISVTADFEKTDKVNSFTYIVDKSSLGFPDHDFAMISIGIGFAGIEINPETKEVILEKNELITENIVAKVKKAGVKSTGNGYKPGVSAPVSTSVVNVYLEPGKDSFEDLLTSEKDANWPSLKELKDKLGKISDHQKINIIPKNKITTKKWLTPKGTWVNDTNGIIPDIEVTLSEKFIENPIDENDNQLEAALKEISK